MIITVNEELGVVVAESKTKHGLSVCCPEDKFDLALGIALAKGRMVPKDVGAWGLTTYAMHGGRAFLIRQREIHHRYTRGMNQEVMRALTSKYLAAADSYNMSYDNMKKLMESLKPEPAATPPVEPSEPAAPSSQSHVTLTSGEYLRLLALAKRAEAVRGTEPIDTRRPRDK